MAWEYGFHNSVNGDRTYNADQMSSIFNGLITDGVYESVGNKLTVQASSGMVVQIDTGRGWFNGKWVNNTSPYLITLEDADVTLNRYAAICVRGDNTNSVRSTLPYVKYSEYATIPVKPTMTREDDIKEYCLAYVYIKAGATSITNANIEDTRQDTSLCGWVTGLIEQITPETLYNQFTAQFNEWFAGIQDDLDENTKTMLVAAMPTTATVTLGVDNWTELESGGLTQTVTVTGMTPTKTVFITPTLGTDSRKDFDKILVKATEIGTNTITFYASDYSMIDIDVDILYMGK